MNGTSMAPKTFKITTSNAVSFQMCADYIGTPFYPNDSKVNSRRLLAVQAVSVLLAAKARHLSLAVA